MWAVVWASRPALSAIWRKMPLAPRVVRRPPRLLSSQGGVSGRFGPVWAFVEPAVQVGAELWVDGDFADLVAFAQDSQGAFAGGELDVVQVQADGFDDPDAGVERQLRQDSIAGRRVGLDGVEPSEGWRVLAAPTCLAPRHLALSFVDVDQVGDDNYERLSAHCEAVLKFVRILLEAFPIAPVDTTVAPAVVQCRATGPGGPFRTYSGRPPSRSSGTTRPAATAAVARRARQAAPRLCVGSSQYSGGRPTPLLGQRGGTLAPGNRQVRLGATDSLI